MTAAVGSRSVRVAVGDDRYEVVVAPGALRELGTRLQRARQPRPGVVGDQPDRPRAVRWRG